MYKKPVDSRKSIFAGGLWGKIFTEGFMIGILTLLAFSIGTNLYGVGVGRTMAFLSLGLLELVHSFNIRTEESIFKKGLFSNPYLLLAFLAGGILQITVTVVPKAAYIFDCVALNKAQWFLVAVISVSPIFIMEIQKKINEIRVGKIVYCNYVKNGIK